MPKKVSEIQKKEMLDCLMDGNTLDDLAKKFNFTKLTITRHLKSIINETDLKRLIEKNNNKKDFSQINKKFISVDDMNKDDLDTKKEERNFFKDDSFIEITPVSFEIDNVKQKDLSSIPISDIDLPKIVYMIVDRNIELEIKLLKEYPEWEFLDIEELNRKTIEIYTDLKVAKRNCKKEKRVIKVPNTNVFKIVASQLIAKGITRIVSNDTLIAL